MKTITVNGPSFQVVFEIPSDRGRAVIMSTYARGDRPSVVSTGRDYVAHDLRVARNRPDCTVTRS